MPTAPSRSIETDLDDDAAETEEIDETSDPFEILAAREEASGMPLYFMNNIEVH